MVASAHQVANDLLAWATHFDRTHHNAACASMRRAAGLIREQQETIRSLEKDLSEAHDVIIHERF